MYVIDGNLTDDVVSCLTNDVNDSLVDMDLEFIAEQNGKSKC